MIDSRLGPDRISALERRIDMLEALVLRLERGEPAPPILPPSPAETAYALQLGAAPPDPVNSEWIPILHATERPEPDWPTKPCYLPALYLTEPPQDGVKARLEIMRVRTPHDPTWKVPQPGIDEPRCSSCWAMIDPFSNADLDYLSHLVPAGTKKPRRPRQRHPQGSGGSSSSTEYPASQSPADGRGVSSPPPPVPPVLPDAAPLSTLGDLPLTPQAGYDIFKDLDHLKRLAENAGLFDDRRLS